jgi:hypothetical protein
MAFIGNQPTAVPLTSSQLTDGLITTDKLAASAVTSAKILDSTIVNADIASTTINLTQKVTGTLPVANGGTGLTALGTSLQVLRTNTSATALEFAAVSDNFSTELLHVRDEKASGTSGGTFTIGDWRTRTLNTVMTNEISGASLSSNQITLPSGTYYIDAILPAYNIENHKGKLRNVTDSSDVLIGTSEYAQAIGIGNSTSIRGRFTISAQKTFELQHRSGGTQATNGFGTASGFSVVEVYADVQIWKVA